MLLFVLPQVGVFEVNAEKVSISMPGELARFVEEYRKKHSLNRSQVFEEAVKLLRDRELEAFYREANAEVDEDWDVTVADGLADETW
jgi:antitoxin ParD1/3/4